MAGTDWAAWSRESVALMEARNAEWPAQYGVQGAPYRWDLEKGTLRFTQAAGDVVASLCLVGTVDRSDGTFMWSWADVEVPANAREGIDVVRRFGDEHDLPLLMTGVVDGGHAQALELLAVAGRILDADGVFMDTTDDLTLYFTLTRFRRENDATTPGTPGSPNASGS